MSTGRRTPNRHRIVLRPLPVDQPLPTPASTAQIQPAARDRAAAGHQDPNLAPPDNAPNAYHYTDPSFPDHTFEVLWDPDTRRYPASEYPPGTEPGTRYYYSSDEDEDEYEMPRSLLELDSDDEDQVPRSLTGLDSEDEGEDWGALREDGWERVGESRRAEEADTGTGQSSRGLPHTLENGNRITEVDSDEERAINRLSANNIH
jgi:hypothetical protein